MATPFIYAPPDQVFRDRAEYARRNIARGREVVAVEYVDGIVFCAENPSLTLRKISEIYDRIAFAGVGKHNEYESMRIAGIQQAELTGFNYSREDVNARSLANSYSQTLGRIFTEAFKPYEVEILVAQVGIDGQPNEMYRVDFGGFMTDEHGFVAIGGRSEELATFLQGRYQPDQPLDAVVRIGVDAIASLDGGRTIDAESLEVAVLDRTLGRRKFRRLERERITQALQA